MKPFIVMKPFKGADSMPRTCIGTIFCPHRYAMSPWTCIGGKCVRQPKRSETATGKLGTA